MVVGGSICTGSIYNTTPTCTGYDVLTVAARGKIPFCGHIILSMFANTPRYDVTSHCFPARRLQFPNIAFLQLFVAFLREHPPPAIRPIPKPDSCVVFSMRPRLGFQRVHADKMRAAVSVNCRHCSYLVTLVSFVLTLALSVNCRHCSYLVTLVSFVLTLALFNY